MNDKHFSRRRQRGAASTLVFVGFALVALFFLLTEHRAHFFGWLPFLLLAACPLLHMFHGGHGGHGGHGADDEPRRDKNLPAGEAPPKSDASASPGSHHHH